MVTTRLAARDGVLLPAPDFIKRMMKSDLDEVANHLVVGDCLEILRTLPDNSVDLVHTSPPYNIAKDYKGGSTDLSPLATYLQFLEATINQLKRVLKPNGSIFWQTGYTQIQNGIEGDIHPIDILTYGYFHGSPNACILWDRIIWRYFGGMAFKKKLTNKHETILWYVKPSGATAEPHFEVDAIRERSRELDKRNNFWGRNPGNVWEVDRVAFGSTEQSSHIAVYPEEISEKIVRACSQPGEIVLDPFSGSGTTLKVARSLGRKWLGIEISPIYAREAEIRLGYQQPDERLALASGVVKHEILGSKRHGIEVSEIGKQLVFWARHINLAKSRERYEGLVQQALSDNSKADTQKKRAWIEFDRMIADSSHDDPVVTADRYLLSDYKNRRNLNGVTRYRTALEILEAVVASVQGEPQNVDTFIENLVGQEPSSYALDSSASGKIVTLLSMEKRIKPMPEGESLNTGTDDSQDAPMFQHKLPI